jgi:hypothetical protein
MTPVTITSVDAAHGSQAGGYHMPQRELLTGLQALATSLARWWARRSRGLTVGCWRGAVLVPGAANPFHL